MPIVPNEDFNPHPVTTSEISIKTLIEALDPTQPEDREPVVYEFSNGAEFTERTS